MTTSPEVDQKFSRAEKMTLTVVILASALMAIDIMIVTVALPQIGEDLTGATLAGLQWVLVGYTLTFGALIQPAGSLSDRLGSRHMFIGGMASFAVASLACGLAPNMGALIAFRMIKGAAAAVMFANAMPLLARTFEGQRRTMAIAMWSAIVGVAGVAAPAIGGLLIDLAGWRWMFWINVPIGIIAVLIARRVLGDDRQGESTARRFDWIGSILLAVALGVLNVALTRAQEAGWSDAWVMGGAAVFAVFAVVFVARETRIDFGVLDLGLLANRSFAGVTILAFLNRVGTAGATVYFMIYLQNGHGWSPARTGLFLIPLGVVSLAGSIWAGKLQAKAAPKFVLAWGFVLLAVGALLLAWQAAAGHEPAWMIPATIVWGLGNALANTPLMNVATNAVPIQKVGMATGLLNSFFPIGASLGTLLLGLVFAGQVDPDSRSASALGDAVGSVYLVVAFACMLAVASALVLIARAVKAPQGRSS